MTSSIDSISFLCNVRQFPPMDFLLENGWNKKKGKLPRTFKWVNNGMKNVYEPHLTFYQIWERCWRLRVDLSIPRLINGHNIQLLKDERLIESFDLISSNVSLRTGGDYNVGISNICRIHYAVNLVNKDIPVTAMLAHYSRFIMPRMRRRTEGYDETVYFLNKSRALKIYIKSIEVAAKHGKKSPLVELAKDLVRIEYSLPDEASVKQFVKRKNFKDTTAKTMCSRESIDIAVDEMQKLLRWDSIFDAQQPRIKILFDRTQEMSLAQRLDGFLNAEEIFGKKYYLDKSLCVSKSTYDRNRSECRKIGF